MTATTLPAARRPAAVDPGSSWCGLVIAGINEPIGTEPPPCTLRVAPDALPSVAAAVVDACARAGVDVLLVERGPFYAPRKAPPQQLQRMAAAWHVTDNLAAVIGERARGSGIVVVEVTRQTWSARLLARAGLKGARDDAAVLRALGKFLPTDALTRLGDRHQRDAAGLLVWSALPARQERERKQKEPRARAVRPEGTRDTSTPYVRAVRARRSGDAEAYLARMAAACTCGHRGRGRHRAGCARAAAVRLRGLTLDGWARAERALLKVFGLA